MTPLRICSLLFLFLLLGFIFVSAEDFGVVLKDDKGGEPESTSNDWGGKDFDVSSDKPVKIKYQDGSEVNYGDTSGKISLSEYGEVVEAIDLSIKKAGEYVFGNFKVNLKEGAVVNFKDGELHVDDPGSMISKDDVDFVDSDRGWENNNLKLSGDGVDFMNLEEVSFNEHGFYLESPEGVEVDDFLVYGKGKVYIDDSGTGEPNPDLPGAYISVNPGSGKFTIGSNEFGDSISVKVKPENHYGLKHDVGTDYIGFKSIGGAESSYLTVQDRTAKGYTPNVNAVGYFAIDNDGKAVYMGPDESIYVVSNGNVLSELGASGTTASPIELHFNKMQAGQVVPLKDYGGVIVFGNDGAMGYGNDPGFVLGSSYGSVKAGRRSKLAANLNYGISNTLIYNYNLNKEGVEKLFGLKISDNAGFMNNPANVRMIADTLARFPKAAKYLKTLEFTGSGGGIAGMASGSKIWLYTGGSNTGVLAHEITHTFDFFTSGGFEKDWAAINGGGGVHTWSYGSWGGYYESKSTVGEYVFASDSWWKGFFEGRNGYNNNAQSSGQMAAKVAIMAKYGHIQHYDAARILHFAGYEVNQKDPVSTYNEVIKKWSRA